jgi:hypothetical protein
MQVWSIRPLARWYCIPSRKTSCAYHAKEQVGWRKIKYHSARVVQNAGHTRSNTKRYTHTRKNLLSFGVTSIPSPCLNQLMLQFRHLPLYIKKTSWLRYFSPMVEDTSRVREQMFGSRLKKSSHISHGKAQV